MTQAIQSIYNFFEPVTQHHVAKKAWVVAAEIIKICAAALFLDFTYQVLFPGHLRSNKLYTIAVAAPVVEEMLFRGIFQRTLFFIQRLLFKDEREKSRIFRVHSTAFVFGLAHVGNIHKNAFSTLFQCSWAYFSGISLGYLSEKYRTIAVGILFHGANNMLACVAMRYFSKNLVFEAITLTSLFSLQLIAQVVAETRVGQQITPWGSRVSLFCQDLFQTSKKPLILQTQFV